MAAQHSHLHQCFRYRFYIFAQWSSTLNTPEVHSSPVYLLHTKFCMSAHLFIHIINSYLILFKASTPHQVIFFQTADHSYLCVPWRRYICVIFNFSTAVTIFMFFWVKSPCRPVGRSERFGEAFCFHLQDDWTRRYIIINMCVLCKNSIKNSNFRSRHDASVRGHSQTVCGLNVLSART
jgi:hypothetical protein